MISSLFSRRDFTLQLLLLLPVNAARKAFAAAHVPGPAEEQQNNNDVSHACESIHQEVTFIAGRKRVYEALTDQKQFNRVVQLSAAGMSLGNAATEISPAVGGVFTLFGGHIIGRHIELVPEERVVQAWRVVDWSRGVYSIAKFELLEQGAETRLRFDHTGFPPGQGQHLAEGWKANYWEPLAKYLAQS